MLGNKEACRKYVSVVLTYKNVPRCLSALSLYSILRSVLLKIKVLSPCRGTNHKFMLSFQFSTVEAIYLVSHDCTPISAHSNVSLTTQTLL